MDIRNVLAVGATPAFQAILNALGQLKLEPLGHWGTTQAALLPVTYIIAAGSAAIACLCKARTNKAKALLIGIGLLLFVISYGAYQWVSWTPPSVDTIWLWDCLGIISFVSTYAFFGFIVARVVKFFSQK